jgi:hypothetical protein
MSPQTAAKLRAAILVSGALNGFKHKLTYRAATIEREWLSASRILRSFVHSSLTTATTCVAGRIQRRRPKPRRGHHGGRGEHGGSQGGGSWAKRRIPPFIIVTLKFRRSPTGIPESLR